MKIELSAPSKTFLIGEYAVLCGGSGLLLNTEPRFSLIANQVGEERVSGIAAQSPAGRWLEERAPVCRGWDLAFIDPHSGLGGFGASSAQFLLAHAFTTFLQSSVSRVTQGYDLQALWQDFRVLSGGLASGADLIGQKCGQVALVDVNRELVSQQVWPFKNIGFAVIRTGRKIPTHDHLREVKSDHLLSLVPMAEECIEKFSIGRESEFASAVQKYADQLNTLGLQVAETLELCAALKREPWCLAAKGCGALGADTVLVLFDSAARALALGSLNPVATDQDLSAGLEMNWSWA